MAHPAYQSLDRKVVAWLSPLPGFFQQQQDLSDRRQKGNGHWLLDSPEFSDWVFDSGDVLWYTGIRKSFPHQSLAPSQRLTTIAGAGKTIQTYISWLILLNCEIMHTNLLQGSLVVDHLQDEFRKDPDIGIAYLYCDYHQNQAQTPTNLLASLWEQLLINKENKLLVPSAAKSLYEQLCNPRSRPSSEEIRTLLQIEVAKCRTVFMIVDALDECLDDGADILKDLAMLKPNTRLMFTSRPHVQLNLIFPTTQNLEIRANDADLDKYLTARLLCIGLDPHDTAKAHRLRSTIREGKEFSKKIISGIISRAEGMCV